MRFLSLLFSSMCCSALASEFGAEMTGIGLDSWLWVIGLSGAGGIVSLFTKLQKSEIHGGLALNVVCDLFTSVIAGGFAFFLAEAAGMPSMAKAPFITAAGIAGAKAVTYWVRKYFPDDSDGPG